MSAGGALGLTAFTLMIAVTTHDLFDGDLVEKYVNPKDWQDGTCVGAAAIPDAETAIKGSGMGQGAEVQFSHGIWAVSQPDKTGFRGVIDFVRKCDGKLVALIVFTT